MYNVIEYSQIYSKTFGSLWQYCRDELALNDDGNIIDFCDITLLIHLNSKKE